MNAKLRTLRTQSIRIHILGLVVLAVILGLTYQAEAAPEVVVNPHWNITLTDFGYSDLLFYEDGPFPPGFLHEMISGEWGAAIGYDGIEISQAIAEKSMWLEPFFAYPDWTTNSKFAVLTPNTVTAIDGAGMTIAGFSEIDNGEVKIRIDYEMIDTILGTPMGLDATGPAFTDPSFVLSDRYVLKQKYTVTNITDWAGTLVITGKK